MITTLDDFKKRELHLSLIDAVKNGKLSQVKDLLDKGSDINEKDGMGWTPLLWAAYCNHIHMIKFLIDNGADMTYKALHHLRGTKKMVDFYDLVVDKRVIGGERGYKKVQKWIEENYPEFVAAKKYNL